MSVFREAIYGVRFDDERKEGIIERREEIVRCRDCEYYDDEPDLESSMPKCWRDPDHKGTPIWTRPDGFCAWGERVVDA